MGASSFQAVHAAPTANEAFQAAVHDAHYWHGHGGYSGTIAEKDGYVMGWSRSHPEYERLCEFVDPDKRRYNFESALCAAVELLDAGGDDRPLVEFKAKYEQGEQEYEGEGTVWSRNAMKDLYDLLNLTGSKHVQRMAETYWDKWGPALCVPLPDDRWLFVGYASS